MSDWINPLNEASVALGARFEETWRVVWARDPLKSQVLAFVQAEVDAAVKVAREDAEANAKRAEAAESEVARLKALLEAKQPAQPHTPRVGDVVTWGTCVCLYRVTGFDDHGLAFVESCDRRWPERLQRRAPKGDGLRLATATELASAGLPPAPVDDPAVAKHNEWLRAAASNEAPAAPRVLPEHLAWIEAHAASWEGEGGSMTRADKAARALVAAVARRDGALNAAAAKEVK